MNHRQKAFEADLPRLERELAARDQSNAVVLPPAEGARLLAAFRRDTGRIARTGQTGR